MSSFGHFVWYDYNALDVHKALDFYRGVVGWGSAPFGPEGYQMLTIGDLAAGGTATGGVMAMPAAARAMGAPPHWLGWVAVADVEATLAAVAAHGGRTVAPPFVIPTIGRCAVIADPGGAALGVIQPDSAMHPPVAPSQDMPAGAFMWHELMAGDREQALAFYGAVFGWQAGEQMNPGDGSVYQLFSAPGSADPVGGMMTKPAEMPMAAFVFYVTVDDLDAAIGRIATHGGQVVMGPMQVPGGARILMATDDQGGMFALIGK